MGEERLGGTRRRLTVPEAATVLGVTVDAVRGRIRRGKLASEHDKNGTVHVWVDAPEADRPEPSTTVGEPVRDQSELVEELRDRVRSLEEANREMRRLLAGLIERVPQLEAPRDERESPKSVGEEAGSTPPAQEHQEETSRERQVPWWRRWFG